MTQNWNHQQSIATPPQGASQMDAGCISICVVGDFDRSLPTPTQQPRRAAPTAADIDDELARLKREMGN